MGLEAERRKWLAPERATRVGFSVARTGDFEANRIYAPHTFDRVDATVVSGDAVDVVARLKEESEVPLRSHGSLSMNRALMGAGLVDRVQ